MHKLIKTFIIFLVFLSQSCNNDKTESEPETTDQAAKVEYADDADLYRRAAGKLVGNFSSDLKEALLEALEDGDPVEAIEACSGLAPGITDEHTSEFWTIRRVSDKNRNPGNRADTVELAVLRQLQDSNSYKFLQSWTESDSSVTYRYYQPIRTGKLCLKCHGGMQTLAPGVYKALRKAYPRDKATGYSEGQLRGMFVVESSWPDGKDYATMLLNDSTDQSELIPQTDQ